MNVRKFALVAAVSLAVVITTPASMAALGTPSAVADSASRVALSESSAQAPSPDVMTPRWIVVFSKTDEAALREQGIEIWDRDQEILVAGAGERELEALAAKGLQPLVKIADQGEFLSLLSHEPGYVGPSIPGVEAHTLSPTSDLYLTPRDQSFELPRVRPYAGFRGVPRVALPPIEIHPADRELADAPQTFAVNPLVTQLVNNTSQALWFQYVKDLSGENPVVIGGTSRTILTRYSNAMYPTPLSNAYASEYLLEKAAGWGYTGVRETYTSTNSGCSGQGATVWQNLIFTIPGQIDTDQHQQVLFVTHHDSLSFSVAESNSYAPGADDAISGGSALIEALRLFKDYGFKYTVKIIFFSGEEQGLCGSTAYTRQAQHNMADIWRVVNMDQTAYDGNKNGWMNCYGLLPGSPSYAVGDAFVLANQDYGPMITPANIFRPTNTMCQTDHCPFWNVGVPAVAICEDLMHNEICPCFDQSQTPTCHDTVTQMDPTHPAQLMFDPNFSWPTQKAAIATVAHMAEPLYACPPSAPVLTATPASHVVHLSWPATGSVTNYVVERAPSCAGPFTTLVSATGTTYDDNGLTDGQTYAYRLRTCPNQMSACVAVVPNGPSVVYQPGSATIVSDSGDHDGLADNCELATVQFNLLNNGSVPLTGVKISSITSTYPGVQVATAVAQQIGNLGLTQTAPVTFKFYLGRSGGSANCGQAITFNVVATSDQAPTSPSSFVLNVERNAVANPTYNFDTDFSGWTGTSGTWSRIAGGAPGSTPFSVHSQNANNVCAAIQSPQVIPSASSTMTMWVNYGIDGTVTDRAVVRAINQITSVKTLLIPTGAPYTTTAPASGLGCDGIDSQQGWAGNATSWQQATFDLSPFAGTPTKIEVRYATDNAGIGSQGFWFDAVQITNPQSCDTQTNTCSPLPAEVSADGGPVAFTIGKNGASYDLRFSEVAGATKYNIYGGSIAVLRSNTYDHAAAGGVCSLTDATSGDGQVTASLPSSTFANDSYFLVAAQNTAGESVYGHRTGGASIPLALSSCP